MVWHIAEFAWAVPNEGTPDDRLSDGCHAWATGAVEDGWRGSHPSAVSIEPHRSIDAPRREVSAAAIAAESKEWPLFSVRGYTDGAYCAFSRNVSVSGLNVASALQVLSALLRYRQIRPRWSFPYTPAQSQK